MPSPSRRRTRISSRKFGFLATVTNVAGSYIGAGMAMKKGAKIIRPMFLAILALLFVRLMMTMIG